MLPRPAQPTLFPYTTLFRSRINSMTRPPDVKEMEKDIEQIRLQKEAAIKAQDYEKAAALRDRKSTRLNSSHTVTSYAVFCLKKKIPDTKATTHIRRGDLEVS